MPVILTENRIQNFPGSVLAARLRDHTAIEDVGWDINGTSLIVQTPWGNGFRFNGTDCEIVVGNDTPYDFTSEITICSLFKPSVLADGKGIVMVDSRRGIWQYQNDELRTWIRKGDDSGYVIANTTTSPLAINTWIFAASRFDGNRLSILINGGNEAAGTNWAGTMKALDGNDWTFGSFAPGDARRFAGDMALTLIYPTAITDGDLDSLYNRIIGAISNP